MLALSISWALTYPAGLETYLSPCTTLATLFSSPITIAGFSQVWWYTPLTSALGSQRQASLVFWVSSRTSRATQGNCLKTKTKTSQRESERRHLTPGMCTWTHTENMDCMGKGRGEAWGVVLNVQYSCVKVSLCNMVCYLIICLKGLISKGCHI